MSSFTENTIDNYISKFYFIFRENVLFDTYFSKFVYIIYVHHISNNTKDSVNYVKIHSAEVISSNRG
jgi:hypothetical protein